MNTIDSTLTPVAAAHSINALVEASTASAAVSTAVGAPVSAAANAASSSVSSPDSEPFEYDPFIGEYAATAAARAALDATQLAPMNLDMQDVVPVVLRAVSTIHPLRAEIIDELPRFNIARLDALESLAHALTYAQSLFLSASTPPKELPGLFARAVELRDIFLLDTTLLARREIIAGTPLSELKGPVGYANVASDLRVLINIYQGNWALIRENTSVRASEINEASRIFRQMTSAVAERPQQSAVVAAASDQRQRAFTLVMRAYEDARRAVAYLRSESDAEKIAPSLWKGRGRRSNGTGVVAPADTGPSPVGADAIIGHVAPANVPNVRVAPGMPGGSPFIDG